MRGYKSKFEPKNKHKYRGDYTNITSRSTWERWCFSFMDSNTNIKWWASETFIVPYLSPVDNRIHRYFTDIIFEMMNGEITVVEIKPFNQTQPPKQPKRKSPKSMNSYMHALKTYCINQAKWKAAEKVCLERGYKFQIFTENELRRLGAPF